MNGWILFVGDIVPELQRGFDEARKMGINVEVVNPKDVDIIVDLDEPRIFVGGKPQPLPLFVIAGFVEEHDYYNLALLRQLEVMGSLCVNVADTLINTGDKLRAHQLLVAHGIPSPKTALVRKGMTADELIEHMGLPMVLKVLDGSKGDGVILVDTRAELDKLLQILSAGDYQGELLAQKFIATSSGRDVRILVVNRKPLVAMMRSSGKKENFKSNYSQGGQVASYELTDEMRTLAQKVIDIFNLNIGGLDLLFTDDGFAVLEVNSMPGFQGIESCIDINVPMEILKSIMWQLVGRKKTPIQMRNFMRNSGEKSSISEKLNKAHDINLTGYYQGLCELPQKTQEAVLLDILQQNASSEIGKKHVFADIKSIDEFRARVPISQWSDYEEFAQKMMEGETDLLFSGETKHFIISSGTTGKEKYIPESIAGALAKSITSRLRTSAIISLAPAVLKGKILPLANTPNVGTTASGISVGSASGLTLESTSETYIKKMAFPMDIYDISDQALFDYLMFRFALEEDVRGIVGNNAGRAEQLFIFAQHNANDLIDDIEQGTISAKISIADDLRQLLSKGLKPNPKRAEELRKLLEQDCFTPRYYWTNLMVFSCWLSGSVGRFTATIRDYLPEQCFLMDCGYGASEGKFNIPLIKENPVGPLALHANFYEFEPIEGGEPLMAHELEDGASYQLIITNYSGLYRYAMKDIVRVEGFTAKTPNILFETKSGEIGNIAGEKLSAALFTKVFDLLPQEWTKNIHHYCAAVMGEERAYWICVEPSVEDAFPLEAMCARIEEIMMEEAIVYKYYRNQSIINPCKLVIMKQGWQENLYSTRRKEGQSTSQVKLPVIIQGVPEREYIDKIIGN